MTDLPATIVEAGEWLRGGRLSALELTQALLNNAESAQDSLAAFITIAHESALAAARQADAELASGVDRGPLHGIPIGVKDIIATVGLSSRWRSLASQACFWPTNPRLHSTSPCKRACSSCCASSSRNST